MNSLYTLLSILTIIELTFQSSCYHPSGKSLCNARHCPKRLHCRGNVGKDSCGCCTVCLKQENEPCSLNSNDNAKCDHSAPYCVKVTEGSQAVCISLKTAIQKNLPKYTRKLRKCRESKQYQKLMESNPLHCFLQQPLPAYYCRKYPRYLDDDCCIHSNGCNPHKKLYFQVPLTI